MPSLASIRDQLSATIVAAIAELNPYPRMPETANLPALIVAPAESDFQGAMGRGLDIYDFDVIVLVSRRDDLLAQYDLDEFVNGFGAKSVRQAVWSTKTLGLEDVDATVTGMRDYGARWDVCQTPHVGARLRVRVLTTGNA